MYNQQSPPKDTTPAEFLTPEELQLYQDLRNKEH